MTDLVALHEIENDNDAFIKTIVETKGANLPASIEDVKGIFEFTDFKAKAWKILISKLSKLEEHSEAYQSALRSGQQWSISALYSQQRIGQLTKEMPVKTGITAPDFTMEERNSIPNKRETLNNQGIKTDVYKEAEKLANNPETLDRVIENTVARGEIPTKTAVLNTIKAENSQKRQAKQKEKHDTKLDNQRPQAVSDYYEAIKGFKAAMDFAIISAKRGKFDPSGKNFLVKKHGEIKKLIATLEDLV